MMLKVLASRSPGPDPARDGPRHPDPKSTPAVRLRPRGIRGAAILGLLSMIWTMGCSTQTLLPREQIETGSTFEGSHVLTRDGLEYRFERVTAAEDSLYGQYTVEVQRHSADYGIYYEDEVRTQSIALDRVESLSMKKRDAGKTFFFGAGVAALGFFIRDLSDGVSTSGGGGRSKNKPDPNG